MTTLNPNTAQWLLDVAAKSVEDAQTAMRETDDYIDMAREKLVEAAHPPSDKLCLASTWSFPARGNPVHYKVADNTITKLGTGGFGVLSVCSGIVSYADKYVIVMSIDQAGMVRRWTYRGLRTIIVGVGEIVKVGQPLADTVGTLELSAQFFGMDDVSDIDPVAFLRGRGVEGLGE